MDKLLLTTLPLVLISLNACVSTTTTQSDTADKNKDIYPVAAVLEQSAIDGERFTYAYFDKGEPVEGMVSVFIREPIDILNPKLVDFYGKEAILSNATKIDTLAINTTAGFGKIDKKRFFYAPTSLQLIGYESVPKGEPTGDEITEIATKLYDLPQTAKIGTSSLISEGDIKAGTLPAGNFSIKWSLENDNSDTAKLCEIRTYDFDYDEVDITEIDTLCYQINKVGEILDSSTTATLYPRSDTSDIIELISQ